MPLVLRDEALDFLNVAILDKGGRKGRREGRREGEEREGKRRWQCVAQSIEQVMSVWPQGFINKQTGMQ